MGFSDAMLLRFASGVPYGFPERQRFELVPKMTTKKCASRALSSHQSCCTNTRTTHTKQNKPYRRLGAVRAGVVGARGRCCPAATVPTVPVADVFPCGVCCCIAQNIQNKIINRKTELCHPSSSTNQSTQQRVREQHTQGRTCLLYTSPSPRDATLSRMPSSA